MTDLAGNKVTLDSGYLTDASMVKVDNKPATIISAVLESTNKYIDVTFSELVYGGSTELLSALEMEDLTAVITNIGGNLNPFSVSIDSVTKTDDTPLIGGESVVRVPLSFAGTRWYKEIK